MKTSNQRVFFNLASMRRIYKNVREQNSLWSARFVTMIKEITEYYADIVTMLQRIVERSDNFNLYLYFNVTVYKRHFQALFRESIILKQQFIV